MADTIASHIRWEWNKLLISFRCSLTHNQTKFNKREMEKFRNDFTIVFADTCEYHNNVFSERIRNHITQTCTEDERKQIAQAREQRKSWAGPDDLEMLYYLRRADYLLYTYGERDLITDLSAYANLSNFYLYYDGLDLDDDNYLEVLASMYMAEDLHDRITRFPTEKLPENFHYDKNFVSILLDDSETFCFNYNVKDGDIRGAVKVVKKLVDISLSDE